MPAPPAYFGVKNFEKYQHYKHRNPPWIKLYYDLLDDDEFILLSEVHRCRYMTLLLIAGRKDNVIPNHPETLRKLMRLDVEPDLTPLFEKKFLLALRKHRASTLRTNALSETETETETELSSVSKKKPQITDGDGFVSQAEEILTFLNTKTGRHYRFREGTGRLSVNAECVVARLKAGSTVLQCKQVIIRKAREWAGDPKMTKFLRPATLFGREKFEQYLGEVGVDEGMS